MKSKYLNEIGCEQTFSREKLDEEWEKIFEKEREEYGLASYDTWNLDITFFEFTSISQSPFESGVAKGIVRLSAFSNVPF